LPLHRAGLRRSPLSNLRGFRIAGILNNASESNPADTVRTSPQLDVTVPVLVLKTGRYVLQHGTLGIVRSLGRLGVPVYVIIEDRFSPIATSRYLAGAFIRDTSNPDLGRLVTDLATIAKRIGRPAILVPTDDTAAAFIGEHAGVLEKWYLFAPIPKELPPRVANKKELFFLCRSIGIPCPEAVFPQSVRDVREFAERAAFPVVIKAADSRRLRNNARSTSIARSPSELFSIYERAEDPESPNLIFQECIPQSCAEDWIFHGYCNPQTDCFVAFTGRKLRSFPPFAGMTTLGISVVNEPLRLQAEKLLRAIGYAGIMDMDYRLDKRDGLYKLLDFNPRIGANFRIFEDRAGLDVIRALHLDLTGTSVRPSPPVGGRKLVVESHDLFASFGYMRQGELTARGWWQTLKGRREFVWFSLVDPIPFPVMCVRLMIFVLGRVMRRSWARLVGNWLGPQRWEKLTTTNSISKNPER
jgi:D-aspartate ligase